MPRRWTRIRARYGELALMLGFPLAVGVSAFVIHRYLLFFIPEEWAWLEGQRRRWRMNDLRQVVALVLAAYLCATLAYLQLARRRRGARERVEPEPPAEDAAAHRRRSSIGWRDLGYGLVGGTLALWPVALLLRQRLGEGFKEVGRLSFGIWAALVIVALGVALGIRRIAAR
jgi:hypothetical protein